MGALDIPKKSEVIVPSICCPVVPFAVSYSGLKPIFCDVSPSDYNIAPNTINDVVSTKTKAVIPVHLFGQAAPMDEIIEQAESHSLFVIEDTAQSFGGKYKGKKFGSFGDISITSFGYSKIIDISSGKGGTGGGGAIFTNDKKFAERAREIVNNWKPYSELRNLWYRGVYNSAFAVVGKLEQKKIVAYKTIPYIAQFLKNMFVYKMKNEWAKKISTELGLLDELAQIRTKNAKLYRKLIRSPSIVHPQYKNESGVYSRYSCLLRGVDRQKFIAELQKRGVLADYLYSPPLHTFYRSTKKLPSSEFVASRIFNLSVEPQHKKNVIRDALLVNEVSDILYNNRD